MRRILVPLVAAAAMLVLPSAANAAFTSAISGTTVTVTGAVDAETFTTSEGGGLLQHDQVGGGFNSTSDWDTTTAGDQTLPADNTIALVLDTAGGDDTVVLGTANFLSAAVSLGDGNDDVTGSGDAETLNGGAGEDVIAGGAGDDVIDAGAGDDLIVWRNGHGSDTVSGGDGDDESRISGSAGADVITVTVVGGAVRVDRTSAGPFTVSHGAVEELAIRTLGGNDTVTGALGLGPIVSLRLEGGVGNDTLTGGDGEDFLWGGPGADAITGGNGSDVIIGGAGSDTITAKEGASDDIRCGTAVDVVGADSNDVLRDCETVTRADHSAVVTATTINATRATNGYTAKVRVSCLSDRACVGNIGLTTRRAIVTSSGVRTVVLFAKVKINVGAGEGKDISVNLSRYAWRLGTRVPGSTRTTIPVQAAVEIKDERYVRRTFRNFALILPT
jgi:Ca2+-binding RTX toxin-like protein